MRDLTHEQAVAVGMAARRFAGQWRRLALDRDDIRQIAAEAVLRADVDERRAPAERAVYLRRRAIGAVIDAMRSNARAEQLWSRPRRCGGRSG